MRLLVYSDLHIEGRQFNDVHPDVDQMDAIVLAGDIGVGTRGVDWANEEFADIGVPVIYVPGNHEYYRGWIGDTLRDMKACAADFVHVLDNEMHIINDCIFFCSTLWTDFNLYNEHYKHMAFARTCMNDFRLITNGKRILRPEDTVDFHREAMQFLDEAMQLSDDLSRFKKVVVTHHGPHPGSVAPQYAGDALTPAFVSDLSGLIEKHKPELWIHGHVHTAFDYQAGSTRVVVNPRGYSREETGFDSKKMVIV